MMSLNQLLEFLRHTPAMLSKQAIAESVSMPNVEGVNTLQALYAYPGDDTAAVALQDQYLLHACEGMLPSFVANHPYFAGWSAVMANVSDIAAMGGQALSVVNSIWHRDTEQAQLLMQGMQDACAAYGVALVGGHSNIGMQYQPTLSVAIQGTAQKLLSILHVKPQQKILIALNLHGQFHPNTVYWKCFERVSGRILQAQLAVLPQLAEQGLAYAARDISNAGILGSLLMLLEATGSGANIDLDSIPKPDGVDWQTWLQIFPSYGFLLTADEDECQDMIELFESQDICCAVIGESNATGKIQIYHQAHSACFWDFQQQRFTGFDYADILKKLMAQSSAIEPMNQEAKYA
ncbi:sll0787 family AIR synthase-like protein [Acinetobacter baumannii]|uniref:sll0787 family AIR synthase-like protein n=1 Tax=Acinetobacter baumannii TaxID=470 RepID=UPI0015809476|nr:sll0787 family AIR synthase-like protein [Acinetobacter baumannii]EHU2105366.1 sll0787 family AIR synthase-like protein [Acinetobacter baumannii]MDC4887060.1 sll0787 family AIR synthase-like protein [Acinetobacter baumannii]MDC4927194.1 sll0787 family AIR synthase-like protein [Acinetobacter baumannii]MDC4941414.1 sll0787 family AIR synthase-like protein [Acinetobacter baumannii]MDC4945283.1 sll0787 family AIR synthase-like protein [Acinetobacter baumannii]